MPGTDTKDDEQQPLARVGSPLDDVEPVELPTEVEADFRPLPETDAAGEPLPETPESIDPFQFDSLQAEEAFEAAVAAANEGDETRAVQEFIRAAKTAEKAGEWYLAALACQRVGDFLFDPRPPQDIERSFRLYRRAVAAYEKCGLFTEARELAFRQMCLRLRYSRQLGLPIKKRAELFLYWLIAGFGYRSLRVIGTACAVILCYGFLYWLTDGVQNARVPARPVDLLHAIYFSGITFATVGYGDFLPREHAQLLALTEGFLGALTMGLFVAVLANRLHQS